MDSTDKSLVEAHLKGDGEAFAAIVRRYGACVLGYLTKMTGSKEQAEDIFQETFKRVHEKAHTLRGEQFKPWLFRIATRAALDSLRRRGRMRVVSLNEPLDCGWQNSGEFAAAVAVGNPEPLQEVIRTEQTEQVRRSIKSLPDRQRATLVLAYYQQLSYREVAKVLGCSLGTVKTQMYRALRTLAQKLPDVWGDIE